MIFFIVHFYQTFFSPFFGPRCRYSPTCSNYLIEAINKCGVFHGIWLGVKRLSKCHPLSDRDTWDPVK